MKHEEKDRVLEQRFQKAGEWKKLQNKFRRVQERRSRSNTVEVLYVQNSVILASMLLTINRSGSL